MNTLPPATKVSAAFRAANPHLYGPNPSPPIPNPEPVEQPPALASAGEGEAPRTGRPRVCFTLRRVRLLDTDAKYTSLKDVLDGLAISRLIPGDREEEISLECKQERVGSFAEEETIIEITTPTP